MQPTDSNDVRSAAIAYATAMNTLDPAPLRGLLAGDFVYESQWVFSAIEGANAYLECLAGKFGAIRRTGSPVRAEPAETRPYPGLVCEPTPCVVVSQGGEPVSTVLFTMTGGLISRIDMCMIPPPETCTRTGEAPGAPT